MHLRSKIWFLSLILCLQAFGLKAQNSPNRPRVGLVLSGGAAKGLAHIGVLKVLEEAGIPIDMVAGTSMGSIVGGLYALGYSADSLEKIALSQNWAALLLDEVSRDNYSNDEKDEFDKYMVSFPVKDLRPRLPGGLKTGQNISLFLNRLTLPAYSVSDFNQLPRPFLCIAADIVTGDEVVLRKGNLARALRASMAIPSVFTPVQIDNHLLVDGGIVNNFPADHLKEMGADIIIGVNLGFRLHSENELNSLSSILEQSVFFRAAERNKQNQKLVDILIQPDVYKNFTAASFNEAAKLIAEGERAARAVWPQLKALADSLAKYQPSSPPSLPPTPEFLDITSININGLKNVSKSFVLNKIKFDVPGYYSIQEIENAVELLYGTRFFSKVEYALVQNPDSGVNLIFDLDEIDYDLLRVGGKYDSEYKATLLVNTTFRNLFLKGSRLTLDFRLGDLSRIKAAYTIHSALHTARREQWINAPWLLAVFPDVTLSTEFSRYNYYTYSGNIKSALYNISKTNLQLKSTNNFSNSVSLSSDLSLDYSATDAKFVTYNLSESYSHLFASLGTTLLVDTRDSYFVPNRGLYTFLRAEAIQDISSGKNDIEDIVRLIGKWSISLPLVRNKLVLSPQTMIGYNFKPVSVPDYSLYIGGNSIHPVNEGSFPFPGIEYFERSGQAVFVQNVQFQFQMFQNHYIIAQGNMGSAQESIYNLLVNRPFYGVCLSYCYNSVVGPLIISVHSSEIHPAPGFFLSFGYRL